MKVKVFSKSSELPPFEIALCEEKVTTENLDINNISPFINSCDDV